MLLNITKSALKECRFIGQNNIEISVQTFSPLSLEMNNKRKITLPSTKKKNHNLTSVALNSI